MKTNERTRRRKKKTKSKSARRHVRRDKGSLWHSLYIGDCIGDDGGIRLHRRLFCFRKIAMILFTTERENLLLSRSILLFHFRPARTFTVSTSPFRSRFGRFLILFSIVRMTFRSVVVSLACRLCCALPSSTDRNSPALTNIRFDFYFGPCIACVCVCAWARNGKLSEMRARTHLCLYACMLCVPKRLRLPLATH